jgi:hypothetical protein
VIEYLPRIHEVLGLIPASEREREIEKEKKAQSVGSVLPNVNLELSLVCNVTLDKLLGL